MTSFVEFENLRPTGSTRIVRVRNKEGVTLGIIKFWGSWRQYTFHPQSETVFNNGCLNEIVAKIEELNTEIRAEWAARRNQK